MITTQTIILLLAIVLVFAFALAQALGLNLVKQVFLKLVKKKIIYRDANEAYLIRYTPFTCKWFSIKLHRILLSDYSCHHDHPWAFLTLILKGGYVEHTPKGSKLYGAGSILYRPATYVHSLEIFQPATTLVVTFKKVRLWGFITKNGWVAWYKYQSTETCE